VVRRAFECVAEARDFHEALDACDGESRVLLERLAVEEPIVDDAGNIWYTDNSRNIIKVPLDGFADSTNGKRNPVYNWDIIDLVFDTILKFNCKPFVELGFMPQDLADTRRYDSTTDTWNQRDYRVYGFACPPKDYQKWHDLIFNLVRHCAEKYGVEEVKTWYWELWNEPDLDYYWKGTIEEFNKLYDYTAAAAKAACSEVRVGGPGTTNPIPDGRAAEYLDKFLHHCAYETNYYTGQQGTPLDFVSFHVKGGGYRADLKNRPYIPPSRKQIFSHIQVGHQIIQNYFGTPRGAVVMEDGSLTVIGIFSDAVDIRPRACPDALKVPPGFGGQGGPCGTIVMQDSSLNAGNIYVVARGSPEAEEGSYCPSGHLGPHRAVVVENDARRSRRRSRHEDIAIGAPPDVEKPKERERPVYHDLPCVAVIVIDFSVRSGGDGRFGVDDDE
jgi:hypothetical protein